MDPVIVYISTSIEDAVNAMHMANVLWDDGFFSYVPQINYHQSLTSSSSITNWSRQNLAILRRCDLVLRLKGESDESAAEIAYAKDHNIPVFDNYKALMTYIREGCDGN